MRRPRLRARPILTETSASFRTPGVGTNFAAILNSQLTRSAARSYLCAQLMGQCAWINANVVKKRPLQDVYSTMKVAPAFGLMGRVTRTLNARASKKQPTRNAKQFPRNAQRTQKTVFQSGRALSFTLCLIATWEQMEYVFRHPTPLMANLNARFTPIVPEFTLVRTKNVGMQTINARLTQQNVSLCKKNANNTKKKLVARSTRADRNAIGTKKIISVWTRCVKTLLYWELTNHTSTARNS